MMAACCLHTRQTGYSAVVMVWAACSLVSVTVRQQTGAVALDLVVVSMQGREVVL